MCGDLSAAVAKLLLELLLEVFALGWEEVTRPLLPPPYDMDKDVKGVLKPSAEDGGWAGWAARMQDPAARTFPSTSYLDACSRDQTVASGRPCVTQARTFYRVPLPPGCRWVPPPSRCRGRLTRCGAGRYCRGGRGMRPAGIEPSRAEPSPAQPSRPLLPPYSALGERDAPQRLCRPHSKQRIKPQKKVLPLPSPSLNLEPKLSWPNCQPSICPSPVLTISME